MADVRSLLKQARQARRITHPYAKYNSHGTLYCTACTQKIASEALWDTHIQSASHKEKVRNIIREGQRKAKRGIAATAMDDEDEKEENESRKRLKVEEEPESEEDVEVVPEVPAPDEVPAEAASGEDALPADFFDPGLQPVKTGVDEDEWAKFQSEIADVVARQEAGDDEDEEELKRGMAEEFDELNSLEDRVERLKKRRAELALMKKEAMAVDVPTTAKTEEEEEEDGDSEEEEEWW
jgi:zinc finger protein 830